MTLEPVPVVGQKVPSLGGIPLWNKALHGVLLGHTLRYSLELLGVKIQHVAGMERVKFRQIPVHFEISFPQLTRDISHVRPHKIGGPGLEGIGGLRGLLVKVPIILVQNLRRLGRLGSCWPGGHHPGRVVLLEDALQGGWRHRVILGDGEAGGRQEVGARLGSRQQLPTARQLGVPRHAHSRHAVSREALYSHQKVACI